jgi:hypothetical protein
VVSHLVSPAGILRFLIFCYDYFWTYATLRTWYFILTGFITTFRQIIWRRESPLIRRHRNLTTVETFPRGTGGIYRTTTELNSGSHRNCSATRANPDIGYSLVENDPLVTRFGFPWRWRDSVNGSLCDWLPLSPSPLSRLTLL